MKTKKEEILDTMMFRYACKHFDRTQKISKEDFDIILESGRLSPSSFGFEPWKMISVNSIDLKEKLAPIAWGAKNSLDGASHVIIYLARKPEDFVYDSAYVSHIMHDIQKLPEDIKNQRLMRFENFKEHDFALLESKRALFDWASKQTYLMMANMMTAAAFLSIDSCPIEGFEREKVDALLAAEGIMDATHFGVSVMAGFGYRKETPHPKTRQALSDILIEA